MFFLCQLPAGNTLQYLDLLLGNLLEYMCDFFGVPEVNPSGRGVDHGDDGDACELLTSVLGYLGDGHGHCFSPNSCKVVSPHL